MGELLEAAYRCEEFIHDAEQVLGISARVVEAVADRATYGGRVSIGTRCIRGASAIVTYAQQNTIGEC